ncbi:MAG: alpha/beta fold hydrolase [Candidatus Latescibacteria bacterium]|nr:alpha/beta fold hydrolase [Candidatus Latescibacterota bacterium]
MIVPKIVFKGTIANHGRCAWTLGILILAASVWAQPPKDLNRTPISDTDFALVADHFAYDSSAPLDAVTIGSWPHRIPYIVEKVEFNSIHDQRVPAYFTHPVDSTQATHPAVLLLHGSNDFWGKNEDWALEWMDILSRQGWCVLVADAYGFGERKRAGQVLPSPQTPYAMRDAVIQSITDQRRALDYLLTRPEIDPAKIALLGGSMGGLAGVLVAGLEQRLAAVVLTVTGAFPGPMGTDHPLGKFIHTLNFAPRITAPALMVNATEDRRALGEELFNALPEPKKQIWYEGGHYLAPREYNEDILAWLHEQLN